MRLALALVPALVLLSGCLAAPIATQTSPSVAAPVPLAVAGGHDLDAVRWANDSFAPLEVCLNGCHMPTGGLRETDVSDLARQGEALHIQARVEHHGPPMAVVLRFATDETVLRASAAQDAQSASVDAWILPAGGTTVLRVVAATPTPDGLPYTLRIHGEAHSDALPPGTVAEVANAAKLWALPGGDVRVMAWDATDRFLGTLRPGPDGSLPLPAGAFVLMPVGSDALRLRALPGARLRLLNTTLVEGGSREFAGVVGGTSWNYTLDAKQVPVAVGYRITGIGLNDRTGQDPRGWVQGPGGRVMQAEKSTGEIGGAPLDFLSPRGAAGLGVGTYGAHYESDFSDRVRLTDLREVYVR